MEAAFAESLQLVLLGKFSQHELFDKGQSDLLLEWSNIEARSIGAGLSQAGRFFVTLPASSDLFFSDKHFSGANRTLVGGF